MSQAGASQGAESEIDDDHPSIEASNPVKRRKVEEGHASLAHSFSTPPARTVFVKKEGDKDYAEVRVASNVSVAYLKEEISKELQLTARLSTLTLHVAKDKDGKELGDPLDSRAPVELALQSAPRDVYGNVTVIVKVDGMPTLGKQRLSSSRL